MMKSTASQPLPPEIHVEQVSPNRVRYVLPRRPLGAYRWLAAAPFAFALLGLCFFWGWFAAIAQAQGPATLAIGAFSALFGIGAVIVPIAIGAAMAWGHSSIEIRGDQLWAIEHVGLFRWGRRRPLAQIRRLEVSSSSKSSSSGPPSSTSPLSRFAAIRIATVRGKPRMAAIGYPREWLLPLAHELARQVGAAQHAPFDPAATAEAPVEVVNVVEVVDDLGPVERLQQPADSRIVMTEQPGSVSFEIPPAGIKRGAGGLFAFACIWIAFMTVCTTVVIYEFSKPAQQPQLTNAFAVIPFLGVFWLVGIGMMLAALNMARRRAAIAVADGRCLVIQAGLFGEKKQVWEAGELTAVQVGYSGIEVNERPLMQLQFIPRAGKKFGVLSGRDQAELEWLATHLTNNLGLVATRTGAAMLTDVDAQPPDSDAVCEQRPGALTISVPRRPWRKGPLGWWIGAVLWNALIASAMTAFVIFGWKNATQSLFPLAFMSVFALTGFALIGMAVHMTIQRAEIAFAADRLLVLRFGLFGKRRNEWAVEELAAVRAAASGTTVNNRRLMQLQIVPIAGKTVALFTGRADQELAWIATVLRRVLKLPAETD
jgi:hypothetical protein